jgi:hypothetical protein
MSTEIRAMFFLSSFFVKPSLFMACTINGHRARRGERENLSSRVIAARVFAPP